MRSKIITIHHKNFNQSINITRQIQNDILKVLH